jgi:hypothetical protein
MNARTRLLTDLVTLWYESEVFSRSKWSCFAAACLPMLARSEAHEPMITEVVKIPRSITCHVKVRAVSRESKERKYGDDRRT